MTLLLLVVVVLLVASAHASYSSVDLYIMNQTLEGVFDWHLEIPRFCGHRLSCLPNHLFLNPWKEINRARSHFPYMHDMMSFESYTYKNKCFHERVMDEGAIQSRCRHLATDHNNTCLVWRKIGDEAIESYCHHMSEAMYHQCVGRSISRQAPVECPWHMTLPRFCFSNETHIIMGHDCKDVLIT